MLPAIFNYSLLREGNYYGEELVNKWVTRLVEERVGILYDRYSYRSSLKLTTSTINLFNSILFTK